MALQIGDKIYRNLQEQVEKNKQDIESILQGQVVLDEFGIKVVGQEDSIANLPTVAEYKEDNENWEYGDTFAIGTESPYELYILTRADANHNSDYWFDIGAFPAPGEQGEQGIQGEPGAQGTRGSGWFSGGNPSSVTNPILNDLFYVNADGMWSDGDVLKYNGTTWVYTGSIKGEQGIRGQTGATGATGAAGANGAQGEIGYGWYETISGISSGYQEIVMSEISGSVRVNDLLISTSSSTEGNFGVVTAVNTSDQTVICKYLGKLKGEDGTGTGTEAVWGNISGTLSNQTDLQTALNGKENTISDLSTIRSGAAAGATAVQPAALTDYYNKASIDNQMNGKLGNTGNQILSNGTLTINNGALAGSSAKYTATSIVRKEDEGQGEEHTLIIPDKNGTLATINDISTAITNIGLATVATTGSYNDLTNKPTIPDVSGYLPLTGGTLTGNLKISKSSNDYGKLTFGESGKDIFTIRVYNSESETSANSVLLMPRYLSDLQLLDSSGNYINFPNSRGTVALTSDIPTLATVATSGSYNDLSNKPTIPAAQVNSDWNAASGVAQILNKPSLATVATTGSYTDLSNKPTNVSSFTNDAGYITAADIPDNLEFYVCTQASDTPQGVTWTYTPFEGQPQTITGTLVASASTMNKFYLVRDGVNDSDGYDEYITTKIISEGAGDDTYVYNWELLGDTHVDLSNYPTNTQMEQYVRGQGYAVASDLATVATSGSYNDLSNKPTIPAAQVNSDWNAASGVAQILNKPSLATVATSGSYNDLSNKPTIPAAQIQSDWTQTTTTALDYIKNKPSLATVATSGSYNDLSDKPTIPSLPTVINDRYLHTNASTGALEWSTVSAGTTYTAGDGISISNGTISVSTIPNSLLVQNPGSYDSITYGTGTLSIYKSKSGLTNVLTVPEKTGTLAITNDIPDVSNYLPLSGGTLTGNLKVEYNDQLSNTHYMTLTNTGLVRFNGAAGDTYTYSFPASSGTLAKEYNEYYRQPTLCSSAGTKIAGISTYTNDEFTILPRSGIRFADSNNALTQNDNKATHLYKGNNTTAINLSLPSTGGTLALQSEIPNIVYSSSTPSNPTTGMIWLKPANA